MSEKSLLVRVTGRVQGVNYRAWARAEASKLDLRGWVKNEGDGSVKALVAGAPADVNELVRRMHEGPSAASVTSVEAEPAEVPEETGFEIRR